MTTITINSSQPVGGQTFKNFQNEFSAGLCDCFSDCGKCVYAYFCFPCFACQVFTDAGVWIFKVKKILFFLNNSKRNVCALHFSVHIHLLSWDRKSDKDTELK